MAFTTQEKKILRILINKELDQVKKEGKQIFIINSPFLNKKDEEDLPFLKAEKLYQKLLQTIKKKL